MLAILGRCARTSSLIDSDVLLMCRGTQLGHILFLCFLDTRCFGRARFEMEGRGSQHSETQSLS